MLALDDPKTRALILFRAFSQRAVAELEKYRGNPPPHDGSKRSADFRAWNIRDVGLTIAAIQFFSRHFDLFFPQPGDLDRLASEPSLVGAIQALSPDPAEPAPWCRHLPKLDARYVPAALGWFWLTAAVTCLDEVFSTCSEEEEGGTVDLVAHVLSVQRSALENVVACFGRDMPAKLGKFIERRMSGLPDLPGVRPSRRRAAATCCAARAAPSQRLANHRLSIAMYRHQRHHRRRDLLRAAVQEAAAWLANAIIENPELPPELVARQLGAMRLCAHLMRKKRPALRIAPTEDD